MAEEVESAGATTQAESGPGQYDATQPAVLNLSETTERSLEMQFRRDSSPRVRGSITSAFWRATSPPSELSRAVFLAAVKDPDPTVRRAAVSGINRLPTDVAMPLLIAALNDEAPNVRGSVANLLSKRVVDAIPYRAQIEAIASTELDHPTRSQMERLVALLRARD